MNDFIVLKHFITNGRFNIKIPKEIFGDFHCYNINLTTLEGGPEIVHGDFFVHQNYLTDLKGSPKVVKGSFECYSNNLTSLEGCTSEIGKDFIALNNKLTSLKGGPSIVNQDVDFHLNLLINLEYFPKNFRHSGVDSYLTLEETFLHNNKKYNNYWSELFIFYKFFLKNKNFLTVPNLTANWPKDFINSLNEEDRNLLKSTNAISKYSL